MEYVFGTIRKSGRSISGLKTVGDRHTALDGICHIERNYPDCVIVDDFVVKEKYRTAEVDNICYDWYEIEQHSRYIDYFSPVKEEINTNISDTQDALCEASEDFEQRIADIEDALCDLTIE